MDNPQKLATSGKQDEDKQNKNTTQYVLDTTIRENNLPLEEMTVMSVLY